MSAGQLPAGAEVEREELPPETPNAVSAAPISARSENIQIRSPLSLVGACNKEEHQRKAQLHSLALHHHETVVYIHIYAHTCEDLGNRVLSSAALLVDSFRVSGPSGSKPLPGGACCGMAPVVQDTVALVDIDHVLEQVAQQPYARRCHLSKAQVENVWEQACWLGAQLLWRHQSFALPLLGVFNAGPVVSTTLTRLHNSDHLHPAPTRPILLVEEPSRFPVVPPSDQPAQRTSAMPLRCSYGCVGGRAMSAGSCRQ